MSRKVFKAAAGMACLATASVWAQPAAATNGYFVNGFDVSSQGMAGAGLTEGDGPVSSAANPAVGLKMGNVAGGCLSAFMPDRTVTVGSGGALAAGSYTSKDNLFAIPCAGANFQVNDTSAVGVSLVANGGMETRYTSNPFAPLSASTTNPLGVALQQAFISFNGAHNFGHDITLGLAPVFAVQTIRTYGLEAFQGSSQSPSNVTGRGDDWSFGGGLRFGGVWDANKYLSVAAAYQTRMWMTQFSKYSGMFADSAKFDIPAELSAGLTVRPLDTVAVMFDWQRIFYNDVPAIGNTELVSTATNPLGSPHGPGFGWKDMNVFHVGVKWQATDDLTLRTGYSYATDAFNPNEAEFNLISPGIIKHHASIGGSYKLTQNWSVDGAYTHAFANTVNGVGNPYFNSGSQPISLKLSEEIVTGGISYRW